MDSLRERVDSRWIIAILALILGLILGVIYAWVINPVEWVDGTPENLRPDLREDYMRMAIDSYSVNRDVDLAIQRYQALGSFAAEALDAVAANPGEVDETAIQNYAAVVEIMDPESGDTTDSAASSDSTSTGGGLLDSSAMRLLIPVCGGTIALGVLLFVALSLRRRILSDDDEDLVGAAPVGQPVGVDAVPPAELGATVPTTDTLATFRTIYTLGDDLYDDSFSIESPAGDFLGECGVGIGDVIGVGEPKKVSAFEVWLFDKNDIQTVTKVLMSRYAYNDEATKNRLSAKGDPVLAEDGAIVSLDTASLKVEARIVDLKYGEGALPQESFFERITIELTAVPSPG